jgi:hypothetical protein
VVRDGELLGVVDADAILRVIVAEDQAPVPAQAVGSR